MKFTAHCYTLPTTLFLLVFLVGTGNSQTWTKDTFAEFTDGQLDASGHNLYVSRDGTVRTIHRFDLNQDAAFCPNPSGIQHSRRFVTVLWGGSDGWSAERSNGQLPVHTASRIAVADLNHDDWPDIVVLNGPAWLPNQPQGNIVRIFWGSPDGYLFSLRRDLGASSSLDLVAADSRHA